MEPKNLSQPETREPETGQPEMGKPANARRLAIGFGGLTAITYALIVLGALVRSNGAGLACPDWPLCFGEFVPAFDVKVGFEWSHRVLAGSTSLLFLGLSIGCWRDRVTRAAVGRLILLSGAVLSVQIMLGALTVWQLLASWTVTWHLITGNAFAVSLAIIARRLFRLDAPSRAALAQAPPLAAPATSPRTLAMALYATAVLLGGQMVLGGLVSSTYAGLACPDWPTCSDGIWFPSFEGARGAHLLHRLGAYSLATAIAVCALLSRGTPTVARLAMGALALVLAQVGVGVANVLLRLPVEITGLHSALAAALVLVIALAVAEARERSITWRTGRPRAGGAT